MLHTHRLITVLIVITSLKMIIYNPVKNLHLICIILTYDYHNYYSFKTLTESILDKLKRIRNEK